MLPSAELCFVELPYDFASRMWSFSMSFHHFQFSSFSNSSTLPFVCGWHCVVEEISILWYAHLFGSCWSQDHLYWFFKVLTLESNMEIRRCILNNFPLENVISDLNADVLLLENSKFLYCDYDACSFVTGDLSRRLCTTAELKFYLQTSVLGPSSGKPNRNCNSTLWVNGCEPGWACSISETNEIDLKNSKELPPRSANCQPCCDGFFCPQGLTCMFREYINETPSVLNPHRLLWK